MVWTWTMRFFAPAVATVDIHMKLLAVFRSYLRTVLFSVHIHVLCGRANSVRCFLRYRSPFRCSVVRRFGFRQRLAERKGESCSLFGRSLLASRDPCGSA